MMCVCVCTVMQVLYSLYSCYLDNSSVFSVTATWRRRGLFGHTSFNGMRRCVQTFDQVLYIGTQVLYTELITHSHIVIHILIWQYLFIFYGIQPYVMVSQVPKSISVLLFHLPVTERPLPYAEYTEYTEYTEYAEPQALGGDHKLRLIIITHYYYYFRIRGGASFSKPNTASTHPN